MNEEKLKIDMNIDKLSIDSSQNKDFNGICTGDTLHYCVFEPTMKLRYIKGDIIEILLHKEKELQQLHVCKSCGNQEWRKIETV